jgi:hypothetical protein
MPDWDAPGYFETVVELEPLDSGDYVVVRVVIEPGWHPPVRISAVPPPSPHRPVRVTALPLADAGQSSATHMDAVLQVRISEMRKIQYGNVVQRFIRLCKAPHSHQPQVQQPNKASCFEFEVTVQIGHNCDGSWFCFGPLKIPK